MSRSPLSFGPERRVKRRGDFIRIQTSGRKYRSHHFLLIAHPRVDEPLAGRTAQHRLVGSRLGVTITTKIDKRSTRRNRLRRRVREIFRHCMSDFRVSRDLVVIALKGSTELTYSQVEEELCALLKKANLLSRP